jgi:hypothetical protein
MTKRPAALPLSMESSTKAGEIETPAWAFPRKSAPVQRNPKAQKTNRNRFIFPLHSIEMAH